MTGQTRNGDTGTVAENTTTHPPIGSIADLLTFRLARLVAMNDRSSSRSSVREFGLSLNEWRVLGLVHSLAPVRIGRIARILLMDKGQLSRVARRLVETGNLTSEPSADDARAAVLTTTPAGEALHARVLALHAVGNEDIVRPLSREECAEFLRLLDKITTNQGNLLDRVEDQLKHRGREASDGT